MPPTEPVGEAVSTGGDATSVGSMSASVGSMSSSVAVGASGGSCRPSPPRGHGSRFPGSGRALPGDPGSTAAGRPRRSGPRGAEHRQVEDLDHLVQRFHEEPSRGAGGRGRARCTRALSRGGNCVQGLLCRCPRHSGRSCWGCRRRSCQRSAQSWAWGRAASGRRRRRHRPRSAEGRRNPRSRRSKNRNLCIVAVQPFTPASLWRSAERLATGQAPRRARRRPRKGTTVTWLSTAV